MEPDVWKRCGLHPRRLKGAERAANTPLTFQVVPKLLNHGLLQVKRQGAPIGSECLFGRNLNQKLTKT